MNYPKQTTQSAMTVCLGLDIFKKKKQTNNM